MDSIKKINLLFYLFFSFIFLFVNIFSVQAEPAIHVYEDQVLEQSLDPKHADKEVVACSFCYTIQNNDGREVIVSIDNIKVWMRNHGDGSDTHTYGPYLYEFYDICSEISNNGSYAEIFISIWRHYNKYEKFDLTFEFQLN